MSITRGAQTRAASIKATLSDNYLDIQNDGWAKQYLPDLMEKEAEVFGKRTISGFLSQVSATEAMSADQVIWSEQGRLHLSYKCEIQTATTSLVKITKNIDDVAQTTDHGIRVGDMVLLAGGGQTVTGYVSAISLNSSGSAATTANNFITVLPYAAEHLDNAGFIDGDDTCTILVFGSEYAKGTTGTVGANEPSFTTFTNKPIIIKDKYEISGSDAAQIGWVEVSGEDGQNGYYWYLKAEGDTRARFNDYLEMTCIEAEKAATASLALGGALAVDEKQGTEGLFSAIKARGHQASAIDSGSSATANLTEFDNILAEFDRNGAIEENMMFVNRDTALAMDDMLAAMNSYGSGGTSYGVFNNQEDMALNLGFSGFRRGSYDFYKTDWKYLNDLSTRGGINLAEATTAIRGIIVPAGTSSVYDENLGKNMKRPFLHVRYRASELESRENKSWTTGSVGAVTSSLDAMEMHFLSERCMVVQGANNFMLLS